MGIESNELVKKPQRPWPTFANGTLYPAMAWSGIFRTAVEELRGRSGQEGISAIVIAVGANEGEVAHVTFGDVDKIQAAESLMATGRKILEEAGVIIPEPAQIPESAL